MKTKNPKTTKTRGIKRKKSNKIKLQIKLLTKKYMCFYL